MRLKGYQRENIRWLREQGWRTVQIAALFGITRQSVTRALQHLTEEPEEEAPKRYKPKGW